MSKLLRLIENDEPITDEDLPDEVDVEEEPKEEVPEEDPPVDEPEKVEKSKPKAEKAEPTEIGPVQVDGWSVGELGPQGMILSTDGFTIRFDADTLNRFFDLAEAGQAGEIKDHRGQVVYVEPTDDGIVLSREDDPTYPNGVVLDLDVLKRVGIEQHEKLLPGLDDEVVPGAEPPATGEGSLTRDNDLEGEELEEGVRPAWRRAGKKIKRGFRVTSGRRKGRVVANPRTAFKPPAKAKTRTKLKLAARKKRLVRWLKAKRTRAKPISIRLRRLNKT